MKKIIYLLSITVLLVITGCNKFLEGYSPNLVTVRSLSDLDEVMIGSVYVPSRNLTFVTVNNLACWLNYIDDDVNTVVAEDASTNPFGPQAASAQMGYMFGYTTWQLDVSKSYDKKTTYPDARAWRDLYGRINVINIILNEIENVKIEKDTDKADYHRIKAECLFLRAQFYFLLVNIYGKPYNALTAEQDLGVPVKLTHYVEHEQKKDQQFERATVAKVYSQIVEDLRASVENFQTASNKETTLRANDKAAKVLMSRIYLFMEDYENAKKYAEEVVSKDGYLHDIPTANSESVFFSAENSEVYFSQGPLNFQTTFSGGASDFCVTKELGDLYAPEDKRFSLFFRKTSYSDSLAFNRKYYGGIHQSYFSDQFMIRSAEAYLNLAESAAMLGDYTIANQTLNNLKRSRISNYLDEQLSGKELVDEIRDERRRELCFEGHRWFDLRRYSANTKYPYSKEITRMFSVYTQNAKFVQLEEYVLKKNDPAYTFQIPTEVREFQVGMPINERQVREPSNIINIKF